MSPIRPIVLSIAMTMPLMTGAVHGQGGDTPPAFLEAISNVPEDFEPVLYLDTHEWAGHFWERIDTGAWSPSSQDFAFTYPQHLPMGWTPFAAAYDEFEEVYQDRLQLDPDAGPLYLLEDLFEDDPLIYELFKQYTLNEYYEESNHSGLGVIVIDDDPIPPTPCDELPPEVCDFKELLEDWLFDSCVIDVPYKEDGKFFFPGFDCDDFTEAFWAYCRHKQDAGELPPDVEFESLWLWWRFTWGFRKEGGKHGKAGHSVLVVKYGGFYYIIDVQAGVVHGPFPVGTPYKDIDWVPLLDPTPGYPDDDTLPLYTPTKIQPRHPVERPWNDPVPWYDDPDMIEHFENETGCDSDDYIYP